MNKRVYLTFDIETIVSKLSYNPTFHGSVFLGAMYIAHELKKRNQKATFYISLSPKAKEICFSKYIDTIKMLIDALEGYDNIKVEPHIHAFRLPVSFQCEKDEFSAYTRVQQVELLNWSKKFFRKRGIEVKSFRPGGYNVNKSYYEALAEVGIYASSVLLKDEEANIDLINGKLTQNKPFSTESGVKEYPVTSVKVKSIKPGVTETVNLSPDFFTIESVKEYMDQMEYININFHSFSMFNKRLARENHKKQWAHNIKFMLFEKPVSKLLRNSNMEVVHHDTLFYNELIKWLDYIELRGYDTQIIAE